MSLSTASQIDSLVDASTHDLLHSLPRVSVLAASSSSRLYSHSSGYEQISPSGKGSIPLTDQSVFTLWSCTKLVTVIAALQLVEQGKIGLKDDASQWVEELGTLKVLKGFRENGELELEENETVVTVEMLILHTAGFIYEYDDRLTKMTEKLGLTLPYAPDSKRESVTGIPFTYPPGERWHYGTSNDWLVLVVEKASGASSAEEYFQKNIFGPLGITDTSFLPNPSRISMAYDPKTPGGPYTFDEGRHFSQSQHWGGTGLSGSPSSYVKLLQALLRGGTTPDGTGRILKEETVESMFVDHLTTEQQREDVRAFTKTGSDPWTHAKRVEVPVVGHGYGGVLTGEGLPSGRSKGALTWSGYANTYWVIDREKDLAFMIWGNSIGHSNARIFELWREVEPLIYQGLPSTAN